MRAGISVEVGATDRARLGPIVADRNSPQKHFCGRGLCWRQQTGSAPKKIMRRTGTSKVTAWRWQGRFMRAGIAGLLRYKTRPSCIPPLPAGVREPTDRLVWRDQGRWPAMPGRGWR
jgi:hypothetical protein